jgi:DNA-binding transcriptional LysR family regulator
MQGNNRLQRYFRHGTLTHMRVFEAVARLGSFTRAGEETHMAQPTVSVHMKKLAETVGAPLFEQMGKRVRLTPTGEELYATCQRIFEVFGDLDDSLSDLRGLKGGKLRIATTSAGEYLLPQLLAEFVRKHVGIEVSLHVGARQSILQRLADNADDLYLLINAPQDGAVVAHPILPNPLVALAPATHPLAGARNVSFERFAQEPLLVREDGSGTRRATGQLFERHGIKPKIAMQLGSNEAIKEAVIAGLGVSLLYRAALGFDADAKRLAVLDVRGLPEDSYWNFVHPVAKQLPFVAQTFIAFARKEAERICEVRMAPSVAPAGSDRTAMHGSP